MKKYLKIFLAFVLIPSLLIGMSFANSNPYSNYFSSSIKSKLENLISKLEQEKSRISISEFDSLLDGLDNQLSGIESAYPNNSMIKNLVGYFDYEISRLRLGGDLEEIVQELTGDSSNVSYDDSSSNEENTNYYYDDETELSQDSSTSVSSSSGDFYSSFEQKVKSYGGKLGSLETFILPKESNSYYTTTGDCNNAEEVADNECKSPNRAFHFYNGDDKMFISDADSPGLSLNSYSYFDRKVAEVISCDNSQIKYKCEVTAALVEIDPSNSNTINDWNCEDTSSSSSSTVTCTGVVPNYVKNDSIACPSNPPFQTTGSLQYYSRFVHKSTICSSPSGNCECIYTKKSGEGELVLDNNSIESDNNTIADDSIDSSTSESSDILETWRERFAGWSRNVEVSRKQTISIPGKSGSYYIANGDCSNAEEIAEEACSRDDVQFPAFINGQEINVSKAGYTVLMNAYNYSNAWLDEVVSCSNGKINYTCKAEAILIEYEATNFNTIDDWQCRAVRVGDNTPHQVVCYGIVPDYQENDVINCPSRPPFETTGTVKYQQKPYFTHTVQCDKTGECQCSYEKKSGEGDIVGDNIVDHYGYADGETGCKAENFDGVELPNWPDGRYKVEVKNEIDNGFEKVENWYRCGRDYKWTLERERAAFLGIECNPGFIVELGSCVARKTCDAIKNGSYDIPKGSGTIDISSPKQDVILSGSKVGTYWSVQSFTCNLQTGEWDRNGSPVGKASCNTGYEEYTKFAHVKSCKKTETTSSNTSTNTDSSSSGTEVQCITSSQAKTALDGFLKDLTEANMQSKINTIVSYYKSNKDGCPELRGIIVNYMYSTYGIDKAVTGNYLDNN